MAYLRLTVKFEYPEDPTAVEDYPIMGLYFKDPESKSLRDAMAEIHEDWPEFRPEGP